MIEEVIPCTPIFTKGTILGRLQTSELWMKQNEEFPRVEAVFSVQRDIRTLTRSASTSGDYASGQVTKREEDNNIEEGISLIMKREPKC